MSPIQKCGCENKKAKAEEENAEASFWDDAEAKIDHVVGDAKAKFDEAKGMFEKKFDEAKGMFEKKFDEMKANMEELVA